MDGKIVTWLHIPVLRWNWCTGAEKRREYYHRQTSVLKVEWLLWRNKWNPHTYGHLIFDKSAKTIQWKKDSVFNKWCWHNWWLSCRRMWINPFLSPCTKVKSTWIKELHIKPETLLLIEDKVGESLEDMGTGGKFLNRRAMASFYLWANKVPET
jgi:hypothetical protein